MSAQAGFALETQGRDAPAGSRRAGGWSLVPPALALVLLVGNLVFRALTLQVLASSWAYGFTLLLGLATVGCVWRPSMLRAALFLFGASFFLYGFHSYRVQSQLFEYVTTCFALAFVLINLLRGRRRAPESWVARFLLLYALLAVFSLMLLPGQAIAHGLLLRGRLLPGDILTAFPGDPLYAVAAVNRLLLFLVFARQLSLQEQAERLYRALAGGIAAGLLASLVLGLLDFADVVPLTSYSLSETFYGPRQPRLQATFGNPTWYACFMTCATPFLVLQVLEGRPRVRAALILLMPIYGASLFLSASRASWIVCTLVAVALLAWLLRRREEPSSLRFPWVWVGASAGATALVIAFLAYATFHASGAGGLGRRFQDLADTIELRGVLWSPRAAAFAYARELASESPLFGSGYETFKIHLDSLRRLPGSGVSFIPSMGEDYDDAHNSYLQTLVSLGVTGLLVWLALGGVVLTVILNHLRQDASLLSLAMLLSTGAFHLYGLFQGMQYIPVIWMFFAIGASYALYVEPRTRGAAPPATFRLVFWILAGLVACAALFYSSHRGFRHIKERYGLSAYLSSESQQFEGFYPPEAWPRGEFRWMGRRGIINVRKAAPITLVITCGHPDLDREPVLLSFAFNGHPAGSLVFRRPGSLEQRFDPAEPGTLLLTVSRTWVPRERGQGRDRRELGVAVSVQGSS